MLRRRSAFSAAACEFLSSQGLSQLFNLEGGMNSWSGPRVHPDRGAARGSAPRGYPARMMRRIVRALAWGALALVLVGAALFTWWRGLGRAQREGSAVLAGLAAPVSVRFDERAVPHVSASSLLDAAAALGWLHANERFGQMEMQRRYVDGRLAEVLGSRFVALDRGMRELRLARTACAMLPALSERSRAVLEAYARGVNAWIAARGGDLPPELVALRVEPTEWTPTDSLAVQRC